jgi:hypothetical protein
VLDRTDADTIAAFDSVPDGKLIKGRMLTVRSVELEVDLRHGRAAIRCLVHRDTSVDREASPEATSRPAGAGGAASGGKTTMGKIREKAGQRSCVPRTTSRQRTALCADVKECIASAGISTTARASNRASGAALTS